MNIPFIILILGLILVIVFFRNFYSAVYFIVMVDILLRIITYLKTEIIRADAFDFLSYIPADVPSILQSLNLGGLTSVVLFIYVLVYIVFEGLLIRNFFERHF